MNGERIPARLNVETSPQGGASLVRLEGDLDVAESPRVAETFRRLAEAGRTEVVVDASGVQFIDSTGARALVEGHRRIHERGSSFLIVPSPTVRRVIGLLGLGGLLVLADSVEDALAQVGQGCQEA